MGRLAAAVHVAMRTVVFWAVAVPVPSFEPSAKLAAAPHTSRAPARTNAIFLLVIYPSS